MTQSTGLNSGHLSPEIRELVDTIVAGVISLAARASNSNRDSSNYCVYTSRYTGKIVMVKKDSGLVKVLLTVRRDLVFNNQPWCAIMNC